MIHKTKDGKQLLIAEMDNNHIKNTIKMFCIRIEGLSDIVDNGGTNALPKSQFVIAGGAKLYKALSPEAAAGKLQYFVKKIQPYVLEAAIRGIELTAELQKAFNRQEALTTVVEFSNYEIVDIEESNNVQNLLDYFPDTEFEV